MVGSGVNRTILVMPTRRSTIEAREARKRMLVTASHVPNSISCFLDGTDRRVVGAELQDASVSNQRVYVLIRSPGDSGFKAVERLGLTDNDRVMSFHDDDDWSGVPHPPTDQTAALLYPHIPAFDGRSSPRHSGLLSTQHVLFGSIRGDIFNSFVSFANSHPRPSGALDWPLRSVVLASGGARPFKSYQYNYSIGHWADVTSTNHANESVLGEAGWDFSDSRALSMLVVMLDSIALLASHARRTGHPLEASAVADELLGPPFRGARMRKLLRMTAFAGDAVEPLVRRAGRARIRNLYLSGRFSAIDRRRFPALYSFIVDGRVQARGLHHLRDSLVPEFLREFPDEVRPQLEFWQHWVDEAITLRAGQGG
jgi:hypothetical protein